MRVLGYFGYCEEVSGACWTMIFDKKPSAVEYESVFALPFSFEKECSSCFEMIKESRDFSQWIFRSNEGGFNKFVDWDSFFGNSYCCPKSTFKCQFFEIVDDSCNNDTSNSIEPSLKNFVYVGVASVKFVYLWSSSPSTPLLRFIYSFLFKESISSWGFLSSYLHFLTSSHLPGAYTIFLYDGNESCLIYPYGKEDIIFSRFQHSHLIQFK